MLCDRCRSFVPMSEIKYQMKGNSRISLCNKCRGSSEKTTLFKPMPKGKQPFFCQRCRYKFNHDPDSGRQLKCPYCGKPDQVVENTTSSADQLIKESLEYDI